jgi:predicted KAP-like P-loop ATPase
MTDEDDREQTGEEMVKEILEEISAEYAMEDDSQIVDIVRNKLDKFATGMQEYACDSLLNNFTTEELLVIHKWFGDRFVYQVWQDVDWILSKPVISDTIH